MSEPMIGTGRIGTSACRGCGADVEHEEFVGMYGSPARWRPRRHTAPCGAPCLAGGVHPVDYRACHPHGGRWPCGACGKVKPPASVKVKP